MSITRSLSTCTGIHLLPLSMTKSGGHRPSGQYQQWDPSILISNHVERGTPVTLLFIILICIGYVGTYILSIQRENTELKRLHIEHVEMLQQQEALIGAMMEYIQIQSYTDNIYIHPPKDNRPI